MEDQLPDEIQITWHFADVQEIDATLTNDEARRILNLMKQYHDATTGINWGTIEAWVSYFKSDRR